MNTISRSCSLESLTEVSPRLKGLMVGTLEACDMIEARTRNSVYEIFLLDPKSGRAIMRGGDHFANPIEAIVCGSTIGGCMLKVGWLGVGFQMEISANGRRTVTSPIQSLRVKRIDLGTTQVDSEPNESVDTSASSDN